LRVVIVDAHKEAIVAPGETLHPGIEAIFARLGVREAVIGAGFRRQRGIWKEMLGQPRTFEPYGADRAGEWLGFQADRKTLHTILMSAAIDAGAEVMRPAKPSALLLEGARVSGIRIGECWLTARWTLDASGKHAWLARKQQLVETRLSPELRARFGWTDKHPPSHDGQPLFRQHRSGWEWRAPLAENRTALVTLSFVDDGSGRIGRRQGGIDVTSRIYRQCAGPGFFLLGDAAAALDPAASNGVLRAMMSAMLAISIIDGIVRGQTDERTGQNTYLRWVNKQFNHSAARLQILYEPCTSSQSTRAPHGGRNAPNPLQGGIHVDS
jgi:flavin-dependent dehydrogenase